MNKYARGVIAGLLATLVLSMLMFAKGMMGVMPELDIIAMLSMKMGGSIMMGWLAHLMIGALAYGIGFAVLYGVLPGSTATTKGIVLGVVGWLMMMLLVMPMMAMGMFAMSLGIMAPMMTLLLHVIFGAVLGWVYAKLA
ncbi:MAG: hypothetical protein COS34_12125 [Lysobacterales bacterium CG02_land_8_20_14_3_00_62_12]|nr:MAG: hypothetical protein COS34_12125 [Xanthomonadales bacterium CG02_land_8_20_14_3_00_62_12]